MLPDPTIDAMVFMFSTLGWVLLVIRFFLRTNPKN